jgi:hypothetical protein
MEPEFKRVKKTPSKYNLFIYRNKKPLGYKFLFVRNAGIRVIANNKVNIEKQLVDDCFL